VRFEFIHKHQKEFSVNLSCQILKVSRSGYYDWVTRRLDPPPTREVARLQLLEHIRAIHARTRGIYGSPRVYQALRKQGVTCSKKQVARLMREAGIRSTRTRRFRVHTTDSNHPHPIAPNTLNRSFEPGAINERWVTDITYVDTDQGWLYVATVMDLGSRRIIGWSTADHLRAQVPLAAMSKALAARGLGDRGHSGGEGQDLLHHSDRGSQYACADYRALLERHGIACSMSRSGNCYDNAVMESFFKSFKVECVYQEHYQNPEEARASIYQYIELFYNRQRLHSSLGYKTPVEYETALA
jgi:putative transposase